VGRARSDREGEGGMIEGVQNWRGGGGGAKRTAVAGGLGSRAEQSRWEQGEMRRSLGEDREEGRSGLRVGCRKRHTRLATMSGVEKRARCGSGCVRRNEGNGERWRGSARRVAG
jgi:hypothetical protein